MRRHSKCSKNPQDPPKQKATPIVYEEVTLSYCHAHARRKFEQIVGPGKKGKHPIAREALRIYQELYKIERQAKDENLSPEKRHALRLEKSHPILISFHDWLQKTKEKTLSKSPVGKAIAYTLTRLKPHRLLHLHFKKNPQLYFATRMWLWDRLQYIALNRKVSKYASSPLSKLDGSFGIYSKSNGNNGIEIIKSCHVRLTIIGSVSEIPTY